MGWTRMATRSCSSCVCLCSHEEMIDKKQEKTASWGCITMLKQKLCVRRVHSADCSICGWILRGLENKEKNGRKAFFCFYLLVPRTSKKRPWLVGWDLRQATHFLFQSQSVLGYVHWGEKWQSRQENKARRQKYIGPQFSSACATARNI